jgi:hypothetical protein
MAVARGTVRDANDWWMPVLFMRLKSGRLWYVPGFGEDNKTQEFQRWPALINNIRNGRCTPVLGPSLLEPIIGSPQEIARQWADEHAFPLASDERDDLVQVMQYLAISQDYYVPRDGLISHIRQELARRFDTSQQQDNLTALMTNAAACLRDSLPEDPHHILAQLTFPIYLTTNPDTLLHEALRAADKSPVVRTCPWNADLEEMRPSCDPRLDFTPSPQQPLVYHLFGQYDYPASLVLTEDDYFTYLANVKNSIKEVFPRVVNYALTNTALLFLGFHLDDWSFRVLFYTLMSQEGAQRLAHFAHIAVQIDPEGDRIMNPDRARCYLQSYIERAFQGAEVSIYWGSLQDFVRDLHERMTVSQKGGSA